MAVRPILGLRRRAAELLLERGNLFGRAGSLALRLDHSCSEPGCTEEAACEVGWGRQFCEHHYGEWSAREHAEPALATPFSRPVTERKNTRPAYVRGMQLAAAQRAEAAATTRQPGQD